MEYANIYDAKTRFSKYVEQAASEHDVIIARGGKPVSRLTAIDVKKRTIQFDLLKGKVKLAADFDDVLPEDIVAYFEAT
jgi:prevent-host-death family protein